MSRIRRPAPGQLPPDFPSPGAEAIRTFLGGLHWAGLLPVGARIFRYGASLVQVRSSSGPWMHMSEDRYAVAEDAIRYCSLLDVTASDHGERHPVTGDPLPGVERREAWNTAAFRGEFEVTAELPVWVGRAAPMAFDRLRGGLARPGGDGRGLFTTPGGASQILVRRSDLQRGALRPVGVPVPLARVRHLH